MIFNILYLENKGPLEDLNSEKTFLMHSFVMYSCIYQLIGPKFELCILGERKKCTGYRFNLFFRR